MRFDVRPPGSKIMVVHRTGFFIRARKFWAKTPMGTLQVERDPMTDLPIRFETGVPLRRWAVLSSDGLLLGIAQGGGAWVRRARRLGYYVFVVSRRGSMPGE